MRKGSTMYTDTYNVEEVVGHVSGWQKMWWDSLEFKITLGRKKKKKQGKKNLKIPHKYHAAIEEKVNVWKVQQAPDDCAESDAE